MGEVRTTSLAADDTADFECEDSQLAEFFKLDAVSYEELGWARTYVARSDNPDGPRVLGFYSLAMSRLQKDEFPSGTFDRPPRYALPLALVGQLARDRRAPKGTGADLLADAIFRIADIARQIGCIGVVLEARSARLVEYYKSLSFTSLSKGKNASNQKMYLPLAVILEAERQANLEDIEREPD